MTTGDILYNSLNGQNGIYLGPVGSRYMSVLVFEPDGDTIRRRTRTTWVKGHVRRDDNWGMEVVQLAQQWADEMMKDRIA